MKKLWSIPVATVYLYSLTVLTQYGYNSYFNIPAEFVEASLKNNIIYFFQLFTLGQGIAGLLRWWMWIVLIVVAFFIAFLYISHNVWRKIMIGLIFLFFLGSIWYAPTFGRLVARSSSTFLVPETNCSVLQGQTYIVPAIYNNLVIFTPIDASTKKLMEGFVVKDLTNLSCKLQYQRVGKIIK